jgi:DNA repair protein RecN (Recombination protein N)
MLNELRISNFAVIEQLSLQFTHGFHVLTGETGAGKSILVDAIALLVGGRASADQIRSGTEEAVLEASFSFSKSGELGRQFREVGLAGPEDEELIVRRVLSRSGRSRIYVNGNLTPLHLLQALAGTLVDIHGQHEQQSLLSAQAQLDALDAFGQLQAARDAYAAQYERWRDSQRRLEETARLLADRKAQEEFLRFQHQELDEAGVQAGEEETLTAERHRLGHSRRLQELTDEAYDLLYGGDASVLAGLGVVNQRLKELSGIDASSAEWTSFCESAVVQLRELAQRVRAYRQGLEHDPDRLSQIEERLDRLQRLKKKYGGSEEALLARLQELNQQLDGMDRGEEVLTELQAQVTDAKARMQELGKSLSAGRLRAAKKMETRVKDELAELRMDRTRFKIMVAQDEGESPFGPTGLDRVEYLFSANEGEPLAPLARVASGGELSRVMLAMKTVLADTDRVPVLIFDEIDAGIGGVEATVMGRRLRALADYHQVFCITHLPQIAAQARRHVVVEKTVVKKRTVTTARELDAAARENEIARMLGGLAVTKATRQAAVDMLADAEKKR